jgi:hypothetical protein
VSIIYKFKFNKSCELNRLKRERIPEGTSLLLYSDLAKAKLMSATSVYGPYIPKAIRGKPLHKT